MRQTTEKSAKLGMQDSGRDCGNKSMDRQSYDSVSELRAMKPKFADNYAQYKTDGTNWLGVPTRAGVAEILDHGWAEGLAKVRRVLAKLSLPKMPSIRRHKVRADFGDEIDMQRVYGGNLATAWGTTKRLADPRRKATPACVNIVVRVGGHCGMSSEQLFWQGAAAVALVDALKKSGRACKLTAFSHCASSDSDASVEALVDIRVLEPGQQPDLEKLAAVLCLAGFFRTEVFKAMCNMPVVPATHLGYPTRGVPSLLKGEAGTLTVEVTGIYDEFSAKEFLEKVTKQF